MRSNIFFALARCFVSKSSNSQKSVEADLTGAWTKKGLKKELKTKRKVLCEEFRSPLILVKKPLVF